MEIRGREIPLPVVIGVPIAAVVLAGSLVIANRGSETPGSDIGAGSTATHSVTPFESQSALPTPLVTHEGLATSTVPELKKLSENEATHGPVTDQLMLFTDTPPTPEDARVSAVGMATKLHEFKRHKIKPLVVLEPMFGGGHMDFDLYSKGEYDAALDAYFTALKAEGITDDAMGTWVLFPEANAPAWGIEGQRDTYNTDPRTVAANITRTAQIQKRHFPASRATLLLNSQSYPSGDIEWARGSYTSLRPYVENIPKGLIDSIGLQGFPWVAQGGQSEVAELNPATYLNPELVTEAADALGVHDVWFNTGTFSRMHTRDAAQTVKMNPSQRRRILDGVLAQAVRTQAGVNHYRVTVNLFVEDKSGVAEGVDWSYGKVGSDDHAPVLSNFLAGARQKGVNISLFDTVSQ